MKSEGSSSVKVVFRTPNLDRQILLVGFLLPLALDVKKFSDQGDDVFQILLVVVSLISGILYISLEWLSRDIRIFSSRLRNYTAFWWIYIALSPLPVLLWDVDFIHYLKVLLPFTLLGISLVVMMGVERRRVDPMRLVDMLVWGALISTLWRMAYGVIIAGLSIDSIRWQILGPGISYLIGYGIAGLYLRRRRKLAATALALSLFAVLLSISRSYFISLILVIFGVWAIDLRRHSVVRAAKSNLRLCIGVAIVGSLAIALAAVVRPGFFAVWLHRLFEHQVSSGLDITLVTRLAEFRGQIDALTRNVWTLALGNGIGASYTWDLDTLSLLPFTIENTIRWFAGHGTWIYPFFASGIILGSFVPMLLIVVFFIGFKVSSYHGAQSGSRDAIMVFIIFLAYMGTSFTANLFHERYTGIILGVLCGALFIYRAKMKAMERCRKYLLIRS